MNACLIWQGRIAPNGYPTIGRRLTRKDIAAQYGIHPATVSRIVRGLARQETTK